MYFIIHELTFQFYSLIYIYSIINMVFSLIVVPGSPPPSAADESLPQPVEDGSTHSSIRDPRRILQYIPLRPHHDRLATYYLSRREMAARDTHIHVLAGEMTITLQDVAIILGLRIDGPAVTGTCVLYVAELCGELLGVTPPVDALKGSAISICWLCQQLSTLRPDADEVDLERSACGFILVLMGSFMFTDKKGVHVHLCFLPLLRDLTQTSTYSWGGAILAHTYRKLCCASLDRRSGISGCITLIQVCKFIFL